MCQLMSAETHFAFALKHLKQRRRSKKKKMQKFENSEKQVAAVLERGSMNIQFVPP